MKHPDLFEEDLLEQTMLRTDSARKAWYLLQMKRVGGTFLLQKHSGIDGKELDHREWSFSGYQEARDRYARIIKEKTTLGRKRVYQAEENEMGKGK